MISLTKVKNALRPVIAGLDPDHKIRSALIKRRMTERYRRLDVQSAQWGNLRLREAIAVGAPFAAGRCGASELKIVHAMAPGRARASASAAIREEIFVNSGFFPTDSENIRKFAVYYESCATLLDLYGVWRPLGEIDMLERMGEARPAQLCELTALEPYYFDQPWTDSLSDKKVLVVSPFVETFKAQHKILHEVWPRLRFPKFDLLTLRHPHSQALVDTGFRSWWALQDDMKKRMSDLDFDVAIVGAGAGTMPLACHAKAMGRIGVALGGATQLLFGVVGRRWDNAGFFKRAMNESWTRPRGDEVPPRRHRVEGGAYW